MELISINIGHEHVLSHAKASGKTGIYKHPVSTQVAVTRTGLKGDTICDIESHGVSIRLSMCTPCLITSGGPGPSHDLPPGAFGENLTVTDLESAKCPSVIDYI
jgi:MOSC domain-containing protein YiiM